VTAGQHQPAPPAETSPDASIRVTTSASLLSVIPHLLGFQPVSSLIIIGTEPSSHKARVTLRYDLPDPPDPRGADEIIRHAAGILAAQHSTRAVVVGYGPPHLVAPVIGELQESSPAVGLTLTDILRAENGRYWSYLCDRPDCCPADGTPFDPSTSPQAAALTASGSSVLASREELAVTVAAVSGKAATSMRRATRRAEERAARLTTRTGRPGTHAAIVAAGLQAVAEAIACYRSGSQLTPGADAAWLMLVLRDLRVRDDAWSRMVPEYRTAHQKLWTDLTRLARPGHVAAPASLLAFVAWESGNGALANVALDRALADDPRYSMAWLLRQVINSGAPPDVARLLVRDARKILMR
jgi:Domain of unknown function (DUF4192)